MFPGEVLLLSCSKELVNKWLCVYVAETRSKDGNRYSPKTIYALVCGILAPGNESSQSWLSKFPDRMILAFILSCYAGQFVQIAT